MKILWMVAKSCTSRKRWFLLFFVGFQPFFWWFSFFFPSTISLSKECLDVNIFAQPSFAQWYCGLKNISKFIWSNIIHQISISLLRSSNTGCQVSSPIKRGVLYHPNPPSNYIAWLCFAKKHVDTLLQYRCVNLSWNPKAHMIMIKMDQASGQFLGLLILHKQTCHNSLTKTMWNDVINGCFPTF